MITIRLETERLILRQFEISDRLALAKMNSDPEVMRYFPSILSREQSDDLADRIATKIDRNGWGFWALELKDSAEFIGFAGLNQPDDEFPFNPSVEIGWRLARPHWRKGYATEPAIAARDFAFKEIGLDELVSFTTTGNLPSQGVMKKIGFVNTGQNFMHPAIAPENPLCEHVLFHMTRDLFDKVSK